MKKLTKFMTIGTLFFIIIFPFTAEKTSIHVNAQEFSNFNEFNYSAGAIKSVNETIVPSEEEIVSFSTNIKNITTTPYIEENTISLEENSEITNESDVSIEEVFTYTELDKTMYAKTNVNIRNLPEESGEKVATLSFAKDVHVTGQCNETGWYRIEYNETIAYVSNNYLIDTKPETQKNKPKNYNPPSNGSGQAVVDYAVQFVGNPYVWGGTSLTNGADCSGFVQSVYKAFGVSIPRTSYEQRNAGYAVSVSEIQPGDIVCYSGHVAIYIGDGKIVHASNAKEGIKISSYNYRTIIAVRRIY